MSLDAWKPYLDANGLLSPDGKVSHNGLMFSAWYLLWLADRNVVDPEASNEITRVLEVYESCKVPDGGFNRAPAGWTKGFLNQNDDYYAIGLVGFMFRRDFADFTLAVANKHWGILNNVSPGKFAWKAWLFRMPWLKVHLQFCSLSKERPDPLNLAIWALWMIASTFSLSNRDSRIKSYMSYRVASHIDSSPLVRLICSFWKARFLKRFRGIGHAEYFKVQHPVRTLMWDYF